MKRRAACLTVLLVLCVLGQALTAAQAKEGEKEVHAASSAPKGLKAPDRPDVPWAAPDLRAFAEPLREEHPSETDPQKDNERADDIDLAERSNRETQVAWARAKQAASAVGLAQSEYFPILLLRASGSYLREPVPLPLSPTKGGFMDLELLEARPVAALEWV